LTNIDEFSSTLFEQAKRFLEKAEEESAEEAKSAFCNAALLLGFSSLEAHINAMADELTLRPNLGILEQSILSESEYKLKGGKFELTGKLKMYRLEDRIQFIIANFSTANPPTAETWWSSLTESIGLRNQLVHPKSGLNITKVQVASCLSAILACLDHLYISVFKKRYPSRNRGLNSHLSF
jgi:hypothetical protein